VGGGVAAAVGGREEQLPVVFDRVVVLVAAVVGIGVGRRSAAEARCRDGPLALRDDVAGQEGGHAGGADVAGNVAIGAGGGCQVNVFRVGLPGDAGVLEQGAEVGGVDDVVGGVGVRVGVVVGRLCRVGTRETRLLPDVVRLRRVDA